MKQRELRIGNWVNEETLGCVKIGSIDFNNSITIIAKKATQNNTIVDDYFNMSIKAVKPIPLTEEWLVKFGAKKDENGDVFIQDPNYELMRFYLVDGFIQWTKSYCAPRANFEHIKYVHLFQNLYFDWTGEELEINDDTKKQEI